MIPNRERAALTAIDFRLLTAASGTAESIQVSEQQTELRAVITGLHMPDMDGLSFVRVLKNMLPEAGIIIASGRVEGEQEREFQALAVSARLDKPFTQDELVAALKTVFQK